MLGAQALLRERGHRIHTVMVGGDAYDISPEYAARCRGSSSGWGSSTT